MLNINLLTFPSVYTTACRLQCFWWKMFPYNCGLGRSSAKLAKGGPSIYIQRISQKYLL